MLPTSRIVFRPFTEPAPTMPTYLTVRAKATARGLATLLDACHEVA
ncbi:hypothetical protein [Streptomyces sp. NPDC008001]